MSEGASRAGALEAGPVSGQATHQCYTKVQVLLHWTVVALVVAQYATSGAIVRTHSIHLIGQRPNPADIVLHVLHNRVGLLLVAAMIVRLAYRIWFGVPSPVADPRWPWTARLARTVHLAFYAVLITEGVAGAVASYFWWPASALHVALFKVLLVLLTVHVAAALWHRLVRRDTTLSRMKLPVGWPRS